MRSWFSLDLGWIDLGSVTVDTGGELFAPTIWVGQGGRVYAARAVYAVPTLRWPLGPFEFDAGVGPAWVDSRARSRLYSIFDRSVYSQADTHRDLEWLYRLGFRWRVNDSLALELHGQQMDVDGRYRVDLSHLGTTGGSGWNYRFRTRTALFGLRWSPPPGRAEPGNWAFTAGPAISRISFASHYRDTAHGWDLSLRRRIGSLWTVELGHQEAGTARDRPRAADGGPLSRPPFGFAPPSSPGEGDLHSRDLEIVPGLTYLLVGVQRGRSERWSLAGAAGAARADVSFRSIGSPLSELWRSSRYYRHVDRAAFVAQARAERHFGTAWRTGVTVRYVELDGVELAAQPPFGTTKVRLWSVLPQLSLAF